MNVLFVCGSVRKGSTTRAFVEEVITASANIKSQVWEDLYDLPMFHPDRTAKYPVVSNWKNIITQADAIVFLTPEYIHNMPAVLKNALEWLTASGELKDKKVLAFTYAPHLPRGQYALASLLSTLQALDANILVQEQLDHKCSAIELARALEELLLNENFLH